MIKIDHFRDVTKMINSVECKVDLTIKKEAT